MRGGMGGALANDDVRLVVGATTFYLRADPLDSMNSEPSRFHGTFYSE